MNNPNLSKIINKKRLFTILLAIAIVLILSACSQDDKKYTRDEAKKNGDIIVNNQSKKIIDLLEGDTKVINLDKLVSFKNNLKRNKKSKIGITIFDPNESGVKNTLVYDTKNIIYKNNYSGYDLKPGKYKCKSIELSGNIVFLTGCDKGNEKNRAMVFPLNIHTVQAYGEKLRQ